MDVSDLVDDGSLGSALLKNLRVGAIQTEEELRKWATDENLQEGKKALFLLTRGFPQQKAAVLSSLHRLATEREFADILLLVLVTSMQRELPVWEETLQVQAGSGFAAALDKGLVPLQHFDALLRVTRTLLSTWSAPVHEVWVPVFGSLLQRVSTAQVKKHCVPTALHLGESSQAVSTRIVAGQLLGLLAERLQQDFRGEVLQRALSLAQDACVEVRKSMCAQVRKVAAHCAAADVQERLAAEVMKLVNDRTLEVRQEVPALLAEAGHLLPGDTLQPQVVAVLRAELLPTCDPSVRQSLADAFGPLLLQLTSPLRDSGFRRQCIDFFKSLAASATERERRAAAYHFPAVLSALGGSVFAGDLKSSYELLSRDKCVDVKKPIAASLHEVMRLVGKETHGFYPIFQSLLSDPQVAGVLSRNLGTVLTYLSPAQSPAQLLSQVSDFLLRTTSWRLLDAALTQLYSVIDLFPLTELLDRLHPTVVAVYPKVCLPAKVKLVKVLADLIHRTYWEDRRTALCGAVISLTAVASSAQDRIVYVDFCLRVLTLNSRRFFHQYFFLPLMRLAEDPVRNVRVKVAMHFSSFATYFCVHEGMDSALSAAAVRLRTDADYWHCVQAATCDEQDKQKREEAQTRREQQEKDNAKRLDQTEQVRKVYLLQCREKRHSSQPRVAVLKPCATAASITQKGKIDAARHPGHRLSSPSVVASAAVKPTISSFRKK